MSQANHEELNQAWLRAVELDDERDRRRLGTLPFAFIRLVYAHAHLSDPWVAFDELPAEQRAKSWGALRVEIEQERS